MSDTSSETPVGAQPPKLESHPVVDNGANGERLFAAQVVGLPSAEEIKATTAAFQADQDAAFQARQVREGLATSTQEPKVSMTMEQAHADLEKMASYDPAQRAKIAEMAAALKGKTSEQAAPTIVLKPTLMERVASFFGIGKKRETVRP